ncbi:MAG: hypothetical protein L0H19_03920, partial [Salinisphaera sp.]|nr:hypothetical protein [Salinisphaera sp.]
MSRILGIVRQGWFIGLVGVVFLSLIIWFLGPYLALGGWQPFASIVGRLIAILLLFVIWALGPGGHPWFV